MTDDFKPGHYQMFAGSSESITPKSVLWRYMTFEKFCWLVETSKLYHPRLDQFNDPFEGAVTDAYARLRDAGAVEPYFSLKECEPLTFRLLRFRSYATCWHASEHESDAQWQLYASGGAGIAIVSTMERLNQSVDFLPHVHGILGQVEYVDFEHHDMRLRPFGTVISPGHLKRKSFEHEREVRGIILPELLVDEPRFTLDDAFLAKMEAKMPRGIEAKVSLTELIQAIVISPVAAPFVEELVRVVTKRHGLDHLLRKSHLRGTPSY
jgi:hypothetical protein